MMYRFTHTGFSFSCEREHRLIFDTPEKPRQPLSEVEQLRAENARLLQENAQLKSSQDAMNGRMASLEKTVAVMQQSYAPTNVKGRPTGLPRSVQNNPCMNNPSCRAYESPRALGRYEQVPGKASNIARSKAKNLSYYEMNPPADGQSRTRYVGGEMYREYAQRDSQNKVQWVRGEIVRSRESMQEQFAQARSRREQEQQDSVMSPMVANALRMRGGGNGAMLNRQFEQQRNRDKYLGDMQYSKPVNGNDIRREMQLRAVEARGDLNYISPSGNYAVIGENNLKRTRFNSETGGYDDVSGLYQNWKNGGGSGENMRVSGRGTGAYDRTVREDLRKSGYDPKVQEKLKSFYSGKISRSLFGSEDFADLKNSKNESVAATYKEVMQRLDDNIQKNGGKVDYIDLATARTRLENLRRNGQMMDSNDKVKGNALAERFFDVRGFVGDAPVIISFMETYKGRTKEQKVAVRDPRAWGDGMFSGAGAADLAAERGIRISRDTFKSNGRIRGMTIQFSKPGKFTISTPANGNGWTTETIDVAASATSYDEDPFVTESAPSAQIAPRTAPDVSTPPAKASAPPAVPKAPTSSEPVKRSPSTQVAHPPDPQIKRQQPAVPNVEIPNVATPSIKDLPLVEKTPVPNSAVSKEDAPLVRRPAPTPKDLDDGASPMPSPAITKSSETILDMEAKLTQTQKEFLEKKKNAGSVKDLEADAEAYKKVLLDLQKTVGKENKQLDGNLAKVEQLLTVIASWKEYFREATEDAEKFRQPYLDAYAEYTKVENGPDKSAKRDVAMNASEKYYEALAKEQELKNGWSIQLEGDMGISRTLTYTNAQRVEDNKKQIFANTMTVELGKLKVAEEKSQMKKGVPLPPDIRPPTGQKVGPEKTPVVPLVTAPAAPLREGVKEPVLSAAKAPANSKKTLPTPTDATPVVPESVPVAIPSVPTTPQAASPVTSESPQEVSKEDAKAAYESKIKELRSSSDSLNNFYNAADDELIKQDYIAAIQKEIAAIIEGKPVWEEDEALNKTEGERLLRLESEFKRLTKVEKREKVSEVERSELSVVVLNAFESKLLSRSKATVLSKDEADALYEATYSAVANHIPMSNSMINLARTVRKFEPIHPALVMLNPQWNGMGWILKSTTSKSQEVLLQDAERTLAKALDSKQVTDADMKEYMMKMYKVDDAAATLLLTEVKSFLPNAPKVASKPLTDTLKDLEEELPGK